MTARRGRSDDGVVLALVAVAMLALISVTALVVDMGQLRTVRRASQNVADLAALDAGYFLTGRGGDAVTPNPRAACEAALNSVRLNSNFPGSATYPCSSFPETATEDECTPGDAGPVTAGGYELSIRYPVEDADIVDPAYGGPGKRDGKPCQRIQVSLSRNVTTAFAGFFDSGDRTVSAEATALGTVEIDPHATPAFLILERNRCDALLVNNVGGSSRGVIVRAPAGGDENMPGLLHVDSDATGGNCSGSSYALRASSLPDGTPSATVHDAPDGAPGIISIYALRNGNAARAFASYPSGISHLPTSGRISSRKPMDDTYNPAVAPVISQIHAEARPAVMATGSPGVDHTTVSTCSGNVTSNATKVFVNCPSAGGVISFPNATHVVFSGNVSIGNGQSLTLPAATDVVVRGRLAAPQGTITMRAVRRLYVGDGITTGSQTSAIALNSTTATDCTGGLSDEVRVAIFGGSNNPKALQLGSNAALCSTFVYIAGPTTQTAYERHTVTSGGTNCSPLLPCPKPLLPSGTPVYQHATASFSGHPSFDARIKWFAPNRISGEVEAGTRGVEDLALWMESSDTFQVSSNALLEGSGVFFMPNAHANMSSPTSATPRNAQFIARTLSLNQGTLELRPVVTDAIQIPMVGGYGLIR
jgi:hypothetical protein